MGAQTRTDVLPYISLIPVFGYLWPGTSTRVRALVRSQVGAGLPIFFSIVGDQEKKKVFALKIPWDVFFSLLTPPHELISYHSLTGTSHTPLRSSSHIPP